MSALRVVMFGYMSWGHRVLDAVLAAGHEVPLVITHPDSDNPYEAFFNDTAARTCRRCGALHPGKAPPAGWVKV